MLHGAARVPRRAAPRRARRHGRRRRRLRRQQGHQRRRDRGRARRPRRERAPASWSSSSAATARARTSRRSPRRWRATRAPCVTIGRDAAAIERGARAGRRALFERCATLEAAVRAAFAARAGRRRGAAVARPARASTCSATTRTAPRCSSRRSARRRAALERPHEPDARRRRRPADERVSPLCRLARGRGAPAPASRAAAPCRAIPVREWISVEPASRRAAGLRPHARLGRRRAARARPGDGLSAPRSRCPTTRGSRATRRPTS